MLCLVYNIIWGIVDFILWTYFLCFCLQNEYVSVLILSELTRKQFLSSLWEVNVLQLKRRPTFTFLPLSQRRTNASWRKTVCCSVVSGKSRILWESVHVVTLLRARQLCAKTAYKDHPISLIHMLSSLIVITGFCIVIAADFAGQK